MVWHSSSNLGFKKIGLILGMLVSQKSSARANKEIDKSDFMHSF
jgi:hypothetical protein